MSILGSLIGAGSSLLGGLFGRSSERKAIAAQNEYNKPVNIRARAEEGGFNPLAFVGPGVGNQTATGGTNYMGAAVADAGMMLADAMSKRKEASQVSQLERENQKLAEQVQNLTLRPKVGGIYAQREAVPGIGSALGSEHVNGRNVYNNGSPSEVVDSGGDNSSRIGPKDRHTFQSFYNDGQRTDVPIGPDIDEVVTGALIAASNRDKARRAALATQTRGEPLKPPRHYFWGLSGLYPYYVDDYSALLPSSSDIDRSYEPARKRASLSVRRKNPYYARQARVPGY